MKKRRDPHPICRRSVEKRIPRTLKTTPPRYPLDTVRQDNEQFHPLRPKRTTFETYLMFHA